MVRLPFVDEVDSEMDRRTFIGRVAGGVLTVPLAARAQKPVTPVIGCLSSGSPTQFAAFRQGLNEAGYVEGKNVAIEYRWAESHYDRLPALAADLVRRQVAVVVASVGPLPALAAKAATSTIPIVFMMGSNPVELGLVASLGRPGSNATGVYFLTEELVAKRVQLLHELVPKATMIGVLVNPDNPSAESRARQAQESARSLGLQLQVLRARSEQEIDAAFATLVRLRAGALVVEPDLRGDQIVELAARHAVPAIYLGREFVTAGGLMSYAINFAEAWRQAGIYTGKILNGAKPADLPVLQPTKLELVINMKTAKILGLTIPQSLLLRADEVIQ